MDIILYFVWVLLAAICLVRSEFVTNTQKWQPCRLPSHTHMDELTINTIGEITGYFDCAVQCSAQTGCNAFLFFSQNSSCVIMSHNPDVPCSNDGVQFFIKIPNYCSVTAAPSTGGRSFNMSAAYHVNKSPISQITVFYPDSIDTGKFFRGLEVTWQGGEVFVRGHTDRGSGTCALKQGEYVVKMAYTAYPLTSSVYVIGSLTFITTEKTCGPYGAISSSSSAVVEGNKLLYFIGKNAFGFDQLILAFESC